MASFVSFIYIAFRNEGKVFEFDNLPPHTCKEEKSVASFGGVTSGIRASYDVGRIFERKGGSG